jgi:hypothetical protein
MLEMENHIQDILNDIGKILTKQILAKFDTTGKPITVFGTNYTSKGLINKEYQTPYGSVEIQRHVYQSSAGGEIYCPLEDTARIISTSTPRFAKIIGHKVSEIHPRGVVYDLAANHNREISLCEVQNISKFVADLSIFGEIKWKYVPEIEKNTISIVTVGLDGANINTIGNGWRQAMVGTLAFYNLDAERVHTTYISQAPEYGKGVFLKELEAEIQMAKERFPGAKFIGIADGAKDNWKFLKDYTERQILDFFHASEYLTKVADVCFANNKIQRENWLESSCHDLKHNFGGAAKLRNEMESLKNTKKLTKKAKDVVGAAITYFWNNRKRMNYAKHVKEGIPIGSGVTEAACKVIIKQRLCASGMRWSIVGASEIISLRCRLYSDGNWKQFWGKIDRYGISALQ